MGRPVSDRGFVRVSVPHCGSLHLQVLVGLAHLEQRTLQHRRLTFHSATVTDTGQRRVSHIWRLATSNFEVSETAWTTWHVAESRRIVGVEVLSDPTPVEPPTRVYVDIEVRNVARWRDGLMTPVMRDGSDGRWDIHIGPRSEALTLSLERGSGGREGRSERVVNWRRKRVREGMEVQAQSGLTLTETVTERRLGGETTTMTAQSLSQ
jgi:hypothetical protein